MELIKVQKLDKWINYSNLTFLYYVKELWLRFLFVDNIIVFIFFDLEMIDEAVEI